MIAVTSGNKHRWFGHPGVPGAERFYSQAGCLLRWRQRDDDPVETRRALHLASAETGFTFHVLATIDAAEFDVGLHSFCFRALLTHAESAGESYQKLFQNLADRISPGTAHWWVKG